MDECTRCVVNLELEVRSIISSDNRVRYDWIFLPINGLEAGYRKFFRTKIAKLYADNTQCRSQHA